MLTTLTTFFITHKMALPAIYAVTIPIKLYIFFFLIREFYLGQGKRAIPLLFLLGILLGAITEEATWLIKIIREYFYLRFANSGKA